MIAENIENIRRRIDLACQKSGRSPSEVTLVAVSKTFSAEMIDEAVAGGITDIGENYVQELLKKRELVQSPNIRWHFIGHLQSNKIRYLIRWVHLIQTVDSIGLAREINRLAVGAGRTVDVLIEVNTTGEKGKFGVAPEQVAKLVNGMASCTNIRVYGLMTMGPFLPDPEGSRPMFRTLRILKEEISSLPYENVEMKHLSMGMTGDFEVAIEEGATIIRIGTAIFGPRRK